MIEPYYDHAGIQIWHGDCREILPMLDACSIHTCVTSPPYFGLRDYGGGAWVGGDEGCDHRLGALVSQRSTLRNDGREHTGPYDGEKALTAGMPYRDTCGKCGAQRHDAQIGLEQTPAAYVAELTGVFEMVRRVLRDDGTLWCNLGDSYANDTKWGGSSGGKNYTSAAGGYCGQRAKRDTGLKPKDLIGIPWRVAFALQDAGWWLRSEITWCKNNAMPESVTDRPSSATEKIFLLAKSERYWYDAAAIAEPSVRTHPSGNGYERDARQSYQNGDGTARGNDQQWQVQPTRNKRNWWVVNTRGFPGAHFAVFPEKLIEPCILAGCPAGGVVLDPFAGSGTTARVAKRLGRRAIIIEQNLEYCEMAAASLAQDVFSFEVPA